MSLSVPAGPAEPLHSLCSAQEGDRQTLPPQASPRARMVLHDVMNGAPTALPSTTSHPNWKLAADCDALHGQRHMAADEASVHRQRAVGGAGGAGSESTFSRTDGSGFCSTTQVRSRGQI